MHEFRRRVAMSLRKIMRWDTAKPAFKQMLQSLDILADGRSNYSADGPAFRRSSDAHTKV
jgi:hypothetical protein